MSRRSTGGRYGGRPQAARIAWGSVQPTNNPHLRDCQEVNLFYTVPAAKVRPFVPEKYALSGEVNGEGTIFLRTCQCEDIFWEVCTDPSKEQP